MPSKTERKPKKKKCIGKKGKRVTLNINKSKPIEEVLEPGRW